jgi:hypothetical protein
MKNRIKTYFVDLDERLDRAAATIDFCDAIANLCDDLSPLEIDALYRLRGEAVMVFRRAGVRLPWEREEPA